MTPFLMLLHTGVESVAEASWSTSKEGGQMQGFGAGSCFPWSSLHSRGAKNQHPTVLSASKYLRAGPLDTGRTH